MKQRVGSMRKVLSALSTHTHTGSPYAGFCLLSVFFFSQGIDGERERYVHFVFDVTIIYRSGFENVVFFFREKKKKRQKKDDFSFFFRFVYGIRRLGERERDRDTVTRFNILLFHQNMSIIFFFFVYRKKKRTKVAQTQILC